MIKAQADGFFAEIGTPLISRSNAWGCYHHILQQFRALAQHGTIPLDILLSGHMQANLLLESDSGARRGDNWGYDNDSSTSMEIIGTVGYEDDEDDVNQNPIVDISGDKDDDATHLDDDFD